MTRLIPADVRQALRRLAATPFLTLGAILTLAIGIGSAVVMVDILDRMLLRAPAHVTDPDRVSRVYLVWPGGSMDHLGYQAYEAVTGVHDEVEAAATYFTEELSLGRGSDARQIQSVAHTPDYFAVLGVQPLLGSWPSGSDALSQDRAVIGYGLWQQAFGGAADVLGKPLRLGTDTYSVVAVAPRGFVGIESKPVDVWLPLERRANVAYSPGWKAQSFFLQIIARLRPGVGRPSASQHVTAVYRAAQTQSAGPRPPELVLGDLRPARAPGTALQTRVEVLVAGVSIVVLFITCGNVASLLLVRGLGRGRELLVKTALGASRARLLREVMLEAAWLAVGAGVASLFIVAVGGTVMRQLFLSATAALATPLDGRLLLITAAFCAAAAFLLGMGPAIRLTSGLALSPGHAGVQRFSRLLDVFSGLQVALSLPMIVGAALFVASLWNARHQDFGMHTERVAVVTTNLLEVGNPFGNHSAHRAIQGRLTRLPQVESTALVENMPMRSFVSFPLKVPGKDLWTSTFSSNVLPQFNAVDPSFFSVMGMRLIEGRFFTDQENREGARSVAVITAAMTKYIWQGESAVGKCFYLGSSEKDSQCTEVVGVMADARLSPSIRPTSDWSSAFYIPIEQAQKFQSSRALLVRTVGDPANVLRTLQRESQVADKSLPYVEVHAFDDIFMNLLRPWRLGSTVFVIFGAISMLVAAVGLAVVGAYNVTRRTREIGIRSALGAEPRRLIELVLRRSLLVVTAGLAIGLGLAWAAGRLLSAQLFDISANEPRVLIGSALSLLAVATCAAWVPARRAARIDPAIALRAE